MVEAPLHRVFSRIVVGVDGTDFGLEALHQALALAPPESTVIAVTALDSSLAVHGGFLASDLVEQLEQQAAAARAAAAEILGDRPNAEARVVHGDARAVLRGVCAQSDATMLALGGRSRSRFLGMMTGETAAQLVHDGDRTILLARPRWGSRWQPGRIVVGLDGSDIALAALAVADELAERLGCSLRAIAATGGKAVEAGSGWADRVTEWHDGHPVAVLREQSALADLLIVGSRGLHSLRAIGSVSERVAHLAHCSTLVVHPRSG
jgi:nucleotide-binding universal stress UspA family protein